MDIRRVHALLCSMTPDDCNPNRGILQPKTNSPSRFTHELQHNSYMRSFAFLGDLKGAAAPFSVIRSAGGYLSDIGSDPARGAFLRSCACHPRAKMLSLRICRPGFARYRTGQPPRRLSGTGKSAKGVDLPGLGPGPLAGEGFPRQHGLRIHA